MSSAVDILDVLTLAGFVAGIWYLAVTPANHGTAFPTGARAFLVAAATVGALMPVGSLLQGLGLPSPFLPVEDSIELLFIPLVLVATYSVYARQQLLDANRAHEDMLRTREMMVRAIESTPAGTLWVGSDGRIAFANPAAREMLDLDRASVDETTGLPEWEVRVGPGGAGRASVGTDLSGLVTREPLTDVPVIVEWPSGYRRRFSVNTAPTLAPDGHIEGVIASFLDKEPWRVIDDRR
ncbi:MAG TPA: PAS domain-containing protein [Coriobacteriia bacterium]